MSATIESQSKFNENNSTQHRLINFENEHPRAQIYIDNLPNSMTKDDLEKLCNPFGEISYIKFLKHKAENPTGYGFVAFSDLNNAYNAIKGVNGKVIESHYIRASFARPENQILSTTNLYVCGLPLMYKSEQLKELFARFGIISETRVLNNTILAESKGVGFVHFVNSDDAKNAVTAMNNTTPTGMKSPLVVKFARDVRKNIRKIRINDENGIFSENDFQSGPIICKYFQSGKCNRGDDCNYSHAVEDYPAKSNLIRSLSTWGVIKNTPKNGPFNHIQHFPNALFLNAPPYEPSFNTQSLHSARPEFNPQTTSEEQNFFEDFGRRNENGPDENSQNATSNFGSFGVRDATTSSYAAGLSAEPNLIAQSDSAAKISFDKIGSENQTMHSENATTDIKQSEISTNSKNLFQNSENVTNSQNLFQNSENVINSQNLFQNSENATNNKNLFQNSENATNSQNLFQNSENVTNSKNLFQKSKSEETQQNLKSNSLRWRETDIDVSNEYSPFKNFAASNNISNSLDKANGGMSRTNLYVSQFPREWGSDKLEILFAKFGQIDKIRILTPENAEKNRGVGFVHFKEAASAFAAMTATQNFTPKNCFKPIIVKFANQGAKPPRVLNAGPNVCRFWAKGECARGELCNFKHDSYETREEFGVSGAFGGVGGFGAAPLGAFYKGGDVGVAGKAEVNENIYQNNSTSTSAQTLKMNYKGPLDPNGALFKSLSDNSINETTFVDEKESKNLLSISTDLSKNNETFFNEKEKSDYLKMETDFLIKLERPFCFYVGKEDEEERVQNKETGRNLDQYLIEFLIDSIAQTKVLNRRSLKDDISISKSY